MHLLKEFDGYDRQWEEGVNWEDLHPDDDVDNDYDMGMIELQGHRAENRVEPPPDVPDDNDNLEVELEPDFYVLRDQLIAHFTYARSIGEAVWLRGVDDVV